MEQTCVSINNIYTKLHISKPQYDKNCSSPIIQHIIITIDSIPIKSSNKNIM